jgi:hypothetical protein
MMPVPENRGNLPSELLSLYLHRQVRLSLDETKEKVDCQNHKKGGAYLLDKRPAGELALNPVNCAIAAGIS